MNSEDWQAWKVQRSKAKLFADYNEIMNMNCPICHLPLEHTGKTFKCKNGHTFDQARQGYVNLSRKQKASGDNAEMVAARTRFLEEGPYDFMRQDVNKRIEAIHPQTYLDLGCGQGYYTRQLGKSADQAFGIDLSVPAIAHAAGQDKKTQYIVGSIYDLPFADQTIDLATSIFTPVPAAELRRVLKEDGLFISVTPGKNHHYELKEVLYPQVRLNDEMKVPEGFELVESEEITQKKHIDDVYSLLVMTPYFYKTPKEGIEKIRNLKDGLDVTFDFVVSLWRKKHEDKN